MKNNKKGFTIVELVVVIVVIAILAAVLIPTFVNVIKQANLANDQSLIRNMNTTLATSKILQNGFSYAGDAITALNANGFTGKYTPYTAGYHYGYHFESNTMYIIDESNAVIFPKSNVSLSDLWVIWSNNATDKVEGATKYVSLVNVTGGYYSTHFAAGTNYTLDLAGHYINVTDTLDNVTVVNGVFISGATQGNDLTLMTAGSEADVKAGTAEERTVVENKTFSFTEALRNKIEWTSNVTYKNCIFYNWVGSTSTVMENNLTFDGCTFIDTPARSYVFNVQADGGDKTYEGTFTIKDCTFINCERGINIPVFVNGEDNPGKIIITGNTFNAVTEQNRSAIQLMYQKVSGAEKTIENRGYINITISNNNFTEIATTQAGIFTIHDSVIPLSDVSADHLTFSGNTVDSSIPSDKYIVNDNGDPDSAFTSYNITEFKSALIEKFNAGKK